MKKIAYIELDTHAEIALNFIELSHDSESIIVDYYFSEKIIKQIGDCSANIFLVKNSELLRQLAAKEYDLVIIGTAHRYFRLFNEIAGKFDTAIIVHNLNFAKISRFQLFKNIFKKDVKYRLKLALKEGLFSAPYLFKKAKKLVVLDQTLSDSQFDFFPVFYCQNLEFRKSEITTVVIPGTVAQTRRDYKSVLEKLVKFQGVVPIKLFFLGKVSGEELAWIQHFLDIKPENVSLEYFTEKVSAQVFGEIIRTADFLWCPIRRETTFFSQLEIYGETKMSGNIGDAIKYGKPAIFPKNYHTDYPFIIPQETDLENQIFGFNENFTDYFQEHFNIGKVKAALHQSLTKLLS